MATKAFQKIYTKISQITKATCTLKATGVGADELAMVDGKLAQVVKIAGDEVTLQVFEGTGGIPTDAEVVFMGKAPTLKVSEQLAGRFFNAYGNPIDGGPEVEGVEVEIGGPSVNPVRRKQPSELIATGIAGIDLNNTLVSGQKIPFFADPDQPFNQVMAMVALRAQTDKIILGGMGMTNDDYLYFKNVFSNAGALDRIVSFMNTTEDPAVERLLVPDMALTAAEYFAVEKNEKVLVLLTDMTSYADSFAIVNSVIYNNVNPDGAVVETDGLLYNVLVHDNTVKEGSAAVVLDEHAAAIHVTAPGEGAQIGGTGKIINTINGEVTSVSGNAYSPLYVGDYITDDTHLRYQLSDQKDAVLFGIGALQETGVDHEGNPVTTIGGYTVPKIRNGKEYTDIIDLSTDCDVLGNVRLFTDKFHGEGEVIRPDYGCFETWNTTPQKVVNVSDNYYPHAGSVVYVGKESEVRLTDALTKDFAPSYLLLHHAAGLRTGEHAVSLYNLAIERDLKPLINDTTASWDMVSLPFSLEVGNGTMLNGVTIDGLPVEAIQAGDESGDDKNRLYLYEYDGAKRAEDLYSVVAPQNSKYWAFENNQMGANVGYLMATPSASDAVTVRFSKSSSALPVYEESAEEGKSILLKQHNLKTLVGGRPHFTYKENMGWNLFGVPYLCSYTTERMSIDHILYTYDPEASRFVSINSWEGNTIAPFSAVFTQTATVKESEELLFAKPVIPLNTLPAPHGVQLKISGSNLSAGCDYVSVVADNVYGEPMNFDMGNDALKMMSFDPRIPQIYVYNEKGVRFAHTQTADIEGETPVGIYTGESGIYEISLTEDSEYDRYDVVVLIDRSTGRKVDLKHAPYSFTVDDRAMETGRFSLSFKTLSDEMQQPTFYSPGKRQLRIVNLQGGESIGIYDTLGRQRASRKAYGESEEFELESGVYMIRIEGSSLVKGKVVVK